MKYVLATHHRPQTLRKIDSDTLLGLQTNMVSLPARAFKLILKFNDRSRERDASNRLVKWWRSEVFRRLGWTRQRSGTSGRMYYVHRRLGLSQWEKPTFIHPFGRTQFDSGRIVQRYQSRQLREVRAEYLREWFVKRILRTAPVALSS